MSSFLSRISRALTQPGHYAPIASPWRDGSHLEPIMQAAPLAADIFGVEFISREQAMTVPALARARGLICTTIARLPLVSVGDDDNDDGRTPDFITAADGVLSPFHRMLWTIDDLFFYGWSLWAVDRDERDRVIAAERVEYSRWSMDADGMISIDGMPANEDHVILIPGTNDGILTGGAPTLTQAMRLGSAAARAAENPSAQVELHQTNDAPMTEDQIDRLVARWASARRGENGGVAYTSNAVEVKEHGASKEHLLIEGRNAVAVDIARLAGIPATMLDATLSGSSLSYQNTAARMAELVTFGLAPLMAAVAARLSQNDVTRAGVRLQFDVDQTFADLTNLFQSTADLGGMQDEELA